LGWYDRQRGEIIYNFDKLKLEIEELLDKEKRKKKEEEKRSEEKIITPVKLDEMDLKILKNFEKNARASVTDIAKTLDVVPPLVTYHLNEHINEYGLIKKYFVAVNPKLFIKDDAYVALLVKFKNDLWSKAFIEAIKDKLFIHAIRILSDDSILMHMHLPFNGVMPLERLLWEYTKEDIVEKFEINRIDETESQSYTLPYELYKNGRFNYPHEEIMRKVEALISAPEQIAK
ncbi:MAG TPA: winged helix-turn-helix transcriptional regulator, partial [Geobacterales bacterium]|nr:winged helix-turn-helix transcriptional regulator [Geobacterales bacterium]